MSKIEWTGKTWNPVTGCDKVSAGCKNCYAMRMAYRLMHIPHSATKYAGTAQRTIGGEINWTGKINLLDEVLYDPLRNNKPTVYFVNSMSDLFHESIPFEFIHKVFTVMALCPQHTFQVLTKRSKRMLEYFQQYGDNGLGDMWQQQNSVFPFLELIHDNKSRLLPHTKKAGWVWDKHADGDSLLIYENEKSLPNVWMGVSVEDQKQVHRISDLMRTPAAVRFLSCEPLIGSVDLTEFISPFGKERAKAHHSRTEHTCGYIGNCFVCPECEQGKGPIHWIIAGGESGHKARPMYPDWIISLKDQCLAASVPFFFKQWGEFQNGSAASTIGYRQHFSVLADGRFFNQNFKVKGISIDEWNRLTPVTMAKVGKKISGRLLDGQEWNQMPTSNTQSYEPISAAI